MAGYRFVFLRVQGVSADEELGHQRAWEWGRVQLLHRVGCGVGTLNAFDNQRPSIALDAAAGFVE